MSALSILHVMDSFDPRYGGPVRSIPDLSERALKHGVVSEFVAFGSETRHISPGKWVFQITRPAAYRRAPELKAWLQSNLPRFSGVVVHSMWLHWAWVTCRECVRAGVPYACFPHGMLEPWPVRGQGIVKRAKKTLYWHLREKQNFANARCVLFATNREKRLAQQTFRLPAVPLETIGYGVDCSFDPDDSLASIPELAGRSFALFLGRLHPKKNPDLLLRAWAMSRPAEWKLVLAGPAEPGYRAALMRLANQLGIEAHTIFLDFVDGPTKSWLFNQARWFLLPSSQENFGVAVLEALQHGCPVVLSDQVGIAEQMPPGAPVLPVDAGCWSDFFATRLSDGPYRNAQMRRQTRAAAAHFDINQVAAVWSRTLKELFGADGVTRSSGLAIRASAGFTD